ncbi:MAG: discoidin domain-containing protein [Lachnospiraceae bacterium]|nr:discoidin domain-containing protein [Lachnospiraceae bacterium]
MKRRFFLGKSKRVLGAIMAAAIALTGIPFPASEVKASDSAITVTGVDSKLEVTAETNQTISFGNGDLTRTFVIENGKLKPGTISNTLGGSDFEPAEGSEEFVIKTLGSTPTRKEPANPLTSVRPTAPASGEEPAPGEGGGDTQEPSASDNTTSGNTTSGNTTSGNTTSGNTTKVVTPAITVSSEMVEGTTTMDKGKATDDDPSTYWCTNPDGREVAFYQIVFPEEKNVTEIQYTPRFDSSAKYNCTGRLAGMRIKVYDGETWSFIKAENSNEAKVFTLSQDNTTYQPPEVITLDAPVKTYGICIMMSGSYYNNNQGFSDNRYMNIAELEILGTDVDAAAGTAATSLIDETKEAIANLPTPTTETGEGQGTTGGTTGETTSSTTEATFEDWTIDGNSVYTGNNADGGGYAALIDGQIGEKH